MDDGRFLLINHHAKPIQLYIIDVSLTPVRCRRRSGRWKISNSIAHAFPTCATRFLTIELFTVYLPIQNLDRLFYFLFFVFNYTCCVEVRFFIILLVTTIHSTSNDNTRWEECFAFVPDQCGSGRSARTAFSDKEKTIIYGRQGPDLVPPLFPNMHFNIVYTPNVLRQITI